MKTLKCLYWLGILLILSSNCKIVNTDEGILSKLKEKNLIFVANKFCEPPNVSYPQDPRTNYWMNSIIT